MDEKKTDIDSIRDFWGYDVDSVEFVHCIRGYGKYKESNENTPEQQKYIELSGLTDDELKARYSEIEVSLNDLKIERHMIRNLIIR